ncbi:S-Ena type endospore appendage [Paenibacillus radicis (ex Xue et al. 2023)]|uniref:Endospore appendages core domain-containing protein n=1 Tax=Paenibacillus radicis (ex Xue et al. 2023) TaxID=2972489 RepID=A0ABT1YEC0_9BACL|nr:S-Ena type endospore appendage [Paenibacillus radicis (ex Xue et al. 2023)]MCR8630568.1 hypothetical protein [Paenibacillus radicis (ex Xue et al. 2023)]
MKAVTQTTRQKTVVNVTTGCCSSKRKKGEKGKKRKCKKKPRFDVCEKIKICGRIFQKCDGETRVYFRTVGIHRPSTSVLKIENDSDCQMKAIINMSSKKKIIEQTIDEYQETVFVVGSIKNLKIMCTRTSEEDKICKGKFELMIRSRIA